MNEDRGPWYLLTGLVLGAVFGLFYAWVLSPVRYVDTAPATLREDFKEEYRALIAQAYAATNDLARAQTRLTLLKDSDLPRTLAAQAQHALAQGAPEAEVRALGLLAAAAGQPPASIPTAAPLTAYPTELPSPSPTATPPAFTASPSPTRTPGTTPAPVQSPTLTETGTPRPTRTPTPTPTPHDTRTPTATPAQPFVLQARTLICDPNLTAPLIIVETRDKAGHGVPGVEIIVNWPAGEEHFFTGLKPELGSGYADFEMTPGTSYSLHLAEAGQVLAGLTTSECQPSSGPRIWGSWELVFIQP